MTVDEIAESAHGTRRHLAHKDVLAIHAADFADRDIFIADLFGEQIDGLVAAEADGLVNLNLQDEMTAAF